MRTLALCIALVACGGGERRGGFGPAITRTPWSEVEIEDLRTDPLPATVAEVDAVLRLYQDLAVVDTAPFSRIEIVDSESPSGRVRRRFNRLELPSAGAATSLRSVSCEWMLDETGYAEIIDAVGGFTSSGITPFERARDRCRLTPAPVPNRVVDRVCASRDENIAHELLFPLPELGFTDRLELDWRDLPEGVTGAPLGVSGGELVILDVRHHHIAWVSLTSGVTGRILDLPEGSTPSRAGVAGEATIALIDGTLYRALDGGFQAVASADAVVLLEPEAVWWTEDGRLFRGAHGGGTEAVPWPQVGEVALRVRDGEVYADDGGRPRRWTPGGWVLETYALAPWASDLAVHPDGWGALRVGDRPVLIDTDGGIALPPDFCDRNQTARAILADEEALIAISGSGWARVPAP